MASRAVLAHLGIAPRPGRPARAAGARAAAAPLLDDADGTMGTAVKLPPQLARPFRLVAFEWDRTAVGSRADDAAPVRGPIERLLRHGVLVMVIAGAGAREVDRQLSRDIRGPHRRGLFLATRRGSEVYGFDPAARDPLLRWRRPASPDEERAPTGAADAIAWMLRELARPNGIEDADVLVAGLAGHDARLVPAEAPGAALVSVGAEPGEVPSFVLPLGGGPDGLRALLEAQAALHPVELPDGPDHREAWTLVEDGFVLTREHELESLFAVANGYVGTRGSLVEGSPLSAPATFAAGVFVTPPSGGTPELVRLPDWTSVEASIDGRPLRLAQGETLEHRRILDLRRGELWREWRQRDPAGRITRIRGFRLASRADPHVLVQSITLTPENYGGTVRVRISLPRRHVVRASRAEVALASATLLETPERFFEPPGDAVDLALEVQLGRTYRLDRVVSVRSTRDAAAPADEAEAHLDAALRAQGVEGLVAAHRAAWEARWRTADVVVDGDAEAQRALRFAVYHLLSAANPDDERASIGARALTGTGYRGHVFWDTEIFMLPFFTLAQPEAARALLMYRFHTLPAARANAARLGWRGALYAWESADTGEEVTPPFIVAPDGEVVPVVAGEQEQHISADVAYGVWSYWVATLDERFLLEAGAEILIETARFWASRAERGEDGRYHIRGVMGPDEFHASVDDDAYTNGMARWNLEVGREVAALLAERWPERWIELSRRLRLDAAEPPAWARVAADMYTGLDERSGLFEQFRGYFGLEDIDLAALEPRSAPVDVLLGPERVQRSKVHKQADVVMLLHLLWDRFPPEVREANFRYYEPRCAHDSSLSPGIHALVAARLGDLPLAQRYFRQAAAIDLANAYGNAAGGVHAAALGGLWQAAVLGFAGLELAADGPRLRPNLPPGWTRLAFQVRWRGRPVAFELTAAAPEAHVAQEVRP